MSLKTVMSYYGMDVVSVVPAVNCYLHINACMYDIMRA